jgi:hypothetical protein
MNIYIVTVRHYLAGNDRFIVQANTEKEARASIIEHYRKMSIVCAPKEDYRFHCFITNVEQAKQKDGGIIYQIEDAYDGMD